MFIALTEFYRGTKLASQHMRLLYSTLRVLPRCDVRFDVPRVGTCGTIADSVGSDAMDFINRSQHFREAVLKCRDFDSLQPRHVEQNAVDEVLKRLRGWR